MCSVVLVSGAHFVPVKEKRDVLLQFWGPNAADCRWNSSREKEDRENRYQQCCRQHLGRVSPLMTWLSFHKHRCALIHKHTHTQKMRWGYKPPTLFNYAVKFYPNALVMLRSRKAAASSGTRMRSLKWAKKEGRHPWWHRGKTASPPSWGRSIQNLVFLFCFLLPPPNQKEEEAKMASASFSHGAFLGTQWC